MHKLVITEKPSVAKSISEVLGATEKKDGYFMGNGYFVSWCVGHLIELATPGTYSERWKKWEYATLPMIPEEWIAVVKSDTVAQYKVLKDLIHRSDVTEICIATDAGREGELIARLVLEQAGCHKPMKRLWISSMEEKAIREGFDNLRPANEYDNLYHSALARQRADWLVGLNGTRLFTVLYGGKLLKVGRVQTPTLAMLVDRESEIQNFQKQKYFQVHCAAGGMEAMSDRIDQIEEAQAIYHKIMGQTITITSVEDEKKTAMPPGLYDLTTLQREANKLFGFTAKQTLEYTQSLYEKKLCTYPRTDSQYLTEDMGQTAMDVIDAIVNRMDFVEQLHAVAEIKKILNSKKVSDHHAIIPTVEILKFDMSTLPETEKKVLFLIGMSVLCATGEVHQFTNRKITADCNGNIFVTSGKSVTQMGWKLYEQAFRSFFQLKEKDAESEKPEKTQALSELTEGMTFFPAVGRITEHFTKPPAHFTESSLLSAMEKAGTEDIDADAERKGLGTPATRADIIEKLVKDGYVRREKKQMIPTEDGIKLITILPDSVKSPKLTADWENALTLVAKGQLPMDDFMEGIEEMVRSLVKTYHAVGEEQKQMFQGSDSLGSCPKCGKDVVKGKYGPYCTGKCGMTLGRAMGAALTESQVKNLLASKKILVKGLKGKKGGYDAYLIPEGIEDYSYTKDGMEIRGSQYKFKLEFPKKK